MIASRVASAQVGGIDDRIWSEDTGQAPRHHMGMWRVLVSLVAIPGLPVLAVLVHGFDWVSLVGGVVAGTVAFALVHRPVTGPLVFGAVLLVLSFAALEAVNVLEFHTLSLDGPPPTLHWCGRDYVLGSRTFPRPDTPPESRNDRVVLLTPSGAAVYSGIGCAPAQAGVPTLLFTPTGPSTWHAYGLQGGP